MNMVEQCFVAQYYHASSSKDGGYKVTSKRDWVSQLTVTSFTTTNTHRKLNIGTNSNKTVREQKPFRRKKKKIKYKTARNEHQPTPQALNTIHITHKLVLRNIYVVHITRSSARFPLYGMQKQST
jgi:hypothetical protein